VTGLFRAFLDRLPVRPDGTGMGAGAVPEQTVDVRRARRREGWLMAAAALLSVAGFLGYYLPIYAAPDLFPAALITLPGVASPVTVQWGQILWCVALTMVELVLLTLLNLRGVHAIAVDAGFVRPTPGSAERDALLDIGLQRQATEIARYGIDPFEGLNRQMLFLFNAVLRLKGMLGNQVVRYLARLLLGRYAVRTVLDFVGLPIYMAINAWSVRTVLREARVIIFGQRVIAALLRRLPAGPLPAPEAALLYDTLQYVAVSKRDYHRNHYVLTRELLARFEIPAEARHPLPADYLDRLRRAPGPTAALCRLIILLGFVLDGQLSRRERRRLAQLAGLGILREGAPDVARAARDLLDGRRAGPWLEAHLTP
jgi:hypothetical protein